MFHHYDYCLGGLIPDLCKSSHYDQIKEFIQSLATRGSVVYSELGYFERLSFWYQLLGTIGFLPFRNINRRFRELQYNSTASSACQTAKVYDLMYENITLKIAGTIN